MIWTGLCSYVIWTVIRTYAIWTIVIANLIWTCLCAYVVQTGVCARVGWLITYMMSIGSIQKSQIAQPLSACLLALATTLKASTLQSLSSSTSGLGSR